MSLTITSVADAVAALDYLHRRGLLCDQCGSRVVEHENQFHRRCSACLSPHGLYSKPKNGPNELEKRIISAVNQWFGGIVDPGVRGEGPGVPQSGPGDP